MTPLLALEGPVAPLPLADVDTDKIIPARFLKTVARTGLGAHLFHVAPSFGDIFAANAVKNGLLPAVVPRAGCERLMRVERVSVDLAARTISAGGLGALRFGIADSWREALVTGRDEITDTLERQSRIAAFEARATSTPFTLDL